MADGGRNASLDVKHASRSVRQWGVTPEFARWSDDFRAPEDRVIAQCRVLPQLRSTLAGDVHVAPTQGRISAIHCNTIVRRVATWPIYREDRRTKQIWSEGVVLNRFSPGVYR